MFVRPLSFGHLILKMCFHLSNGFLLNSIRGGEVNSRYLSVTEGLFEGSFTVRFLKTYLNCLGLIIFTCILRLQVFKAIVAMS